MATSLFFTVMLVLVLSQRTSSRPREIISAKDLETDSEFINPLEEHEDILGELEEIDEDLNNCFLMGFEVGSKVMYICQDGIVWAATIEQSAGNCVYRRNVTDPSGESDVREAPINCHQGKEWMEELMSNYVIEGLPDQVLFEVSTQSSSDNNKSY